ncbi:hypothetical protein [Aurantiacibacter aquimixticola]|uniref:hypothetical protein n=1 Tax=Aurantiacibacter aquimixticola TaxID=1958945 RepID=UPI0014021437|nr:hypothetical protein [Aurantiacibacter aquimixticola]
MPPRRTLGLLALGAALAACGDTAAREPAVEPVHENESRALADAAAMLEERPEDGIE